MTAIFQLGGENPQVTYWTVVVIMIVKGESTGLDS